MKLKMDGNPEMDLKRVLAVAGIFPRGIKLDPNQAYVDPKVAVETFNALYDQLGSKVMLIEEPCPKGDLDKLKYVSENSKIPIYADETAATLEDIKKIIKLKAANGVNLKLPKIGGIYWATQAAKLLKDAGLRLQVGIMIESRVGLAAAANFAAGTTNVLDTDMDSDLYFETDITTNDSLPFVRGARFPSGRPGLGVLLKEEFSSVIDRRCNHPETRRLKLDYLLYSVAKSLLPHAIDTKLVSLKEARTGLKHSKKLEQP